MASISISSKIASYGSTWTPEINQELLDLYGSLHANQKPEGPSGIAVYQNIPYGPAARNRLDLYCPRATEPCKKPIILFLHAGGFHTGDINVTSSVHSNLGYYFSRNDCICALMTYQLLPEARYPSGITDITAAIDWLSNHAAEYGGDKDNIIAVGHSAGGAHLISAILDDSTCSLNIKGAVCLSVPLYYDLALPKRRATMMLYHDTQIEREVRDMTAVGKLKRADPKAIALRKLLLLVAEYDTEEIADGYIMFVQEYRKAVGCLPRFEVIKHHNHVSTAFAVGLDDDFLGPRVLAFISELN